MFNNVKSYSSPGEDYELFTSIKLEDALEKWPQLYLFIIT